ncbi:MAG: hypothetical protein RQ760_18010 [Sedimentisphaerales bacterium]|nr:hypothetical protein [Sedimentisphaerales bacterium]
MESYIPLDRQFTPVSKSQEEAEKNEILSAWGHVKPKTWDDIDREFRSVILSEAGAGKTEEFREQAKTLANTGKPSFFIRIEDIESDFYNAFEIGEEAKFQEWLQSPGEAWFFLDSVDEARLENPRIFEKALRRFAKGIAKGAHRAHIYISSRPYAWRPIEDRRLLDEILFLPVKNQEENGDQKEQAKPQTALTIYIMRHLDQVRIQRFCQARAAEDVDSLLSEIGRANLWNLAERPFDLEGILAKWAVDKVLGGRLELLRHNIDKRLRDDHSSDRAQRQPLNLEQARNGARRLSAAVILSGQPGLNVPDTTQVKAGIEAETVLADWNNPKDVRTLLERGLFNDIIYGAVRFRHRDVRELLAAEWFDGLLKSDNSRYSIESLFFREQYGEKIIVPRLRPILPWLILFDDEIRHKALGIHPEIAVEGGDPSRLPFIERERILVDIVRRIASKEDDRSARDNSAIARIANIDLSEKTQQLVKEHGENDDAIFFLGRLVWQGEMTSCVEPFVDFALDNTRGLYARRVSVRAVMTCGSDEQKQRLWHKFNENDAQIPRELLAELIQEAKPDTRSVENLLVTLGKLVPYKRFKATELSSSLHGFVEQLHIISNQQAISKLLDGLHQFLDSPPYVERRECHVSKEYAWLLSIATHSVERLVEARSLIAFNMTAISTMLMVPALRFWRDNDYSEHKGNLQTLVPAWPELNDALYWTSIEQARTHNVGKSNESLTDDWSVSWLGHFWNFDTDSLPRLLEFIRFRKLPEDRLIALSTAVRVYVQSGRPANILINLQDTVAGDPALQSQLDSLLNPPVSETARRYQEEDAEYQRKQKEEEEKRTQTRDTWIANLRANPSRVSNPPNLKPGEFTKDQYWLMVELQDHNTSSSRSEYANWQALIPEFSEPVACAYRDAAVNHWRHYMPNLRSEGAEGNSIPYSLIFAMAGLEIEALEKPEFPGNLDEGHVSLALRYITWELNGFPGWLESMHQAFPDLVEEAVVKELLWELEETGSDKPMHYILHDIVYHAPWLHTAMAPVILDWVETNPTRISANRRYCLHIIISGGTAPNRLSKLASLQITQSDKPESISWWYALLVDSNPTIGIPKFEKWLSGLEKELATSAAQIFITTLVGDRRMGECGPCLGLFRKAEYLKSLYILMHRYIRAKEDTNHTGGGVYSPNQRDDAQDARSRLFNLIAAIPGKESYTIIKQLAHEHPDPAYRPFMINQAYKKAQEDGDLEPWSAEQVSAFATSQTITPATHHQLFDLTMHRLHDLKNWLERGNDSPWKTWQRADEETEMRTLIAGWLNHQCREQYTTAQEPELANSQRMDIWLHNAQVHSPVPIELKLLDKGWTGPKLCERLRNQLAGDYLREESAGCGVMLLVWQGRMASKRWEINGQRIGLAELAIALKHYWQSIANDFPGVEALDVVVIDLTMRAQISDL